MKALRLLAFVCALSSVAHADKLRMHGFGEAALGVSIPVGDPSWNTFADPTFVFSLRGGLELWLFQRVGFAPEVQIDFIPVKTDDGTYRPNNLVRIDTPFSRYRFLFGGRFLFDFGIGAAYARMLIGADYLTGSEQGSLGPFMLRVDFSSTGFTLQPGVGVQLRFLRYGIAGLSIDLPIAFHDFGRTDAGNVQKLTAIDLDLLGTIGFRY